MSHLRFEESGMSYHAGIRMSILWCRCAVTLQGRKCMYSEPEVMQMSSHGTFTVAHVQ